MAEQKTGGYEALVAGVNHTPTIPAVDGEVKRVFYSKPPGNRWLQMWNSPEIQFVRG